MKLSQLKKSVFDLEGRRVLVIGDLMLDRYIFGSVDRISPEAPVPVVNVQRETQVLGGAANVAANMASLGAEVRIMGLTGRDAAGNEIRKLLEAQGIQTEPLVGDRSRPTTLKTRVIAVQQQVVRVDRENREPPKPAILKRMIRSIEEAAEGCDAILISDYGKGVIQPELLDRVRKLRLETSVPVVVDPKDIHFSNYRNFSLVTPNKAEASLASGFKIRTEEELIKAGRSLKADMELENLLITRGGEGMTLFDAEEQIHHIPATAKEVFDVSGAGDTVTAVMALCMASRIAPHLAAVIANAAASVVVGRVGTAIIDRHSLLESLTRSFSEKGKSA